MLRVYAGEDLAFAVTVPGSGSLSTETFTAKVAAPSGALLDASAEVTDAAEREVTITVPKSEWVSGEGGRGRYQLMMDDGTTDTVVLSERIRVLPGLDVNRFVRDYRPIWW